MPTDLQHPACTGTRCAPVSLPAPAVCPTHRCSNASPAKMRTVRMLVKDAEASSASRCCAAADHASRLRVWRRYRNAVHTEATITPASTGPRRQLWAGGGVVAEQEAGRMVRKEESAPAYCTATYYATGHPAGCRPVQTLHKGPPEREQDADGAQGLKQRAEPAVARGVGKHKGTDGVQVAAQQLRQLAGGMAVKKLHALRQQRAERLGAQRCLQLLAGAACVEDVHLGAGRVAVRGVAQTAGAAAGPAG